MRLLIATFSALTLSTVSAMGQTVLDPRPERTSGNPITDKMTCVLSAESLYGQSTPATGVVRLTFQLVDGEVGLINGLFIEPRMVHLGGSQSAAQFTVDSFDIDPRAAAMSTYLKPSEREELKRLMSFNSLERTNGLTRIVHASFLDRTVTIFSLRNSKEVDMAFENCE